MRRPSRPAASALPIELRFPDEPPVDPSSDTERTAVPSWLCAAAVVLALLAAAGSFSVWRARVTPRVVTVFEASRVVGVDASGCPTTASCDYAGQALAGLQQAAALAFPTAQVVAGATTWRSPDETPFSSSLVAIEPDGTTLTVAARCTPAGAPVPASEAVGSRSAVIVVPGRRGCSASVSEYYPATHTATDLSRLRLLAHAAGIQLPG